MFTIVSKIGVFLLLCSCSIQRMATRSMVELAADHAILIEGETDWVLFSRAAPGQIKNLELLLASDPDNLVTLQLLFRAYSSYALLTCETDYLAAKWNGQAAESQKGHLREMLARSAAYGERLALRYGVFYPKVPEALSLAPDQNEDLKLLAAIEGAKILHSGSLKELANMSAAETFAKIVCGKSGALPPDSCDVFEAVSLAEKPAMMGGNLAKAEQMLRAIMLKHPKAWWPRSYLAVHVLSKTKDAEKMAELNAEWKKILPVKDAVEPRLGLFEATARQRYLNLVGSSQL
jgi:hypothetical protein